MLNNSPVGKIFTALAEPTRREIVELLSFGPRSVTQVCEPFDQTLAAILQHLQVLEECGVVRSEKIGRIRTCHIELSGLQLASKWIDGRRAEWERNFDQLGEVVAEEERESAKPIRKRRK
jgi:DNA-binding transcriptional ArsR family regulator